MLTNVSPYLRTSRSFPEDLRHISIEMNKAYIDIALCVNQRTIGIFPSNKPVGNGETWYFDKNERHQGLRKIFTFTTTANIPHGLDITDINTFTKCYGSYTDGTNWYGLIFASSTAIPAQRTFYITPTDIVFPIPVGAPTLTKGILALEWVSNV